MRFMASRPAAATLTIGGRLSSFPTTGRHGLKQFCMSSVNEAAGFRNRDPLSIEIPGSFTVRLLEAAPTTLEAFGACSPRHSEDIVSVRHDEFAFGSLARRAISRP